jgi:SAM-dependent methyltransferase
MDRQTISAIAHLDHPVAAPVSEPHLERLLSLSRLETGARILDLGCAEASWTLRALELFPGTRADGVDISSQALDTAARNAESRGLADRIRLHEKPATEFPVAEPYDLVLCVGATHAFGGLSATMEEVRRFLRPGGLALIGEGFWETPPTPPLLHRLGATLDDYADLPGTVTRMEDAGFRVVYGHTSELAEWDEYEWSWTGSLTRWALDHPGPDGDAALAAALDHRDMWLNGYRGVLGFVTFLLRLTG